MLWDKKSLTRGTNCKTQKHVEAKQYVAKQPMDVLRNQKVIKKYQGTNENKGKMIKNQ